MGELPDCALSVRSCCSALFSLYFLCRTVRGALEHGDAQRVKQQQLGRPHHHLHHIRGLCGADGSHPACHGGALSLSACLASALVGGVSLGAFPKEVFGEGSGCGNR